MDIKNKLLQYSKKIISTEDLSKLLNIVPSDISELFKHVESLVDMGLLEPVKSSGQNSNRRYPLFKKYRIMISSECNQEVTDQIHGLHPMLRRSGYLARYPEEYLLHSDVMEKLNKALFSGIDGEYISRKERSFELFGQEKVLDDKSIQALLKKLQITEDDLKIYDTPEYCFHDYIPVRKEQMTLLVCENKDIWFNIRRCMFEDHWKSIFGIKIDGVVYGEGNRISQRHGALAEYIKFMGNPEVRILYWGDIDREGFDIYRRTKEVNPNLDISLFIPGYRKMIERSKNTEIENSPSDKKAGMQFNDLLLEFSEEEQFYLNTIFADNKLIPQEIISYKNLSEE